jgi:large subunit ribosomal protein L29
MNVNEMKNKTLIELRDDLNGLLQEQFNLRMKKGMGQMTSVHDLRVVRRDIARIKTAMTEKSQKGTAV